jgi:hypothetical protein
VTLTADKRVVATLVLGSRLRQRVARVWFKKETRESHHIFPGVQRVWGHEPSHSQVNSHVGSWSPKRILESSERNCKGQNSSPWRFFYIIEKVLKRKCLKWARITHLNICNTSYGQKKGLESNWQFDSRPLKIKNRFDSLCAGNVQHTVAKLSTRGITLLETTSRSKVCTRSYAPSKLREPQLREFRDSHLGIPRQKAIWMWPLWRTTEYTIRGKVVASPSLGHGESCVFELPVVCPSTKSVSTMY